MFFGTRYRSSLLNVNFIYLYDILQNLTTYFKCRTLQHTTKLWILYCIVQNIEYYQTFKHATKLCNFKTHNKFQNFTIYYEIRQHTIKLYNFKTHYNFFLLYNILRNSATYYKTLQVLNLQNFIYFANLIRNFTTLHTTKVELWNMLQNVRNLQRTKKLYSILQIFTKSTLTGLYSLCYWRLF